MLYKLIDRLSIFFFPVPTRGIVVSEERLQEAEKEAKQARLAQVDEQLKKLKEYKAELEKELEPQTLEEALTGE